MKKGMKPSLVVLLVLTTLAFALTFSLDSESLSSEADRIPASIPDNYETLSACKKQDLLWKNIEMTKHKSLPPFHKLGLPQVFKLGFQKIQNKQIHMSDVAPPGWIKYLHARGAVAKIKIEPKNSKYTGIFQGADCGLLRLSLTYQVEGNRPVAPGIALKVLRDGNTSANISALVSLTGQGSDYNFFANAQSNIVPISQEFGQKIVHQIFRKVTDYPEELVVEDMAKIDSKGQVTTQVTFPRQIFFVPGRTLQFSSQEHDVREDFHKIPEGTVIYSVYAVPEDYKNLDYGTYTDEKSKELLNKSEHVADIISTSEFLSSEFGDSRLFFRHQLRPKVHSNYK